MYCGVETGSCAEHTTTSGDREDLGRQALILHSAHDCSLRRCGLTASSCMSTVYVVMEGGKTLPAAELQVYATPIAGVAMHAMGENTPLARAAFRQWCMRALLVKIT